ncbi:ras GEF [Aureobasidium sp. EXF-10727]|nr:ras GEF [Aureobasidium sp. EXF-10727]
MAGIKDITYSSEETDLALERQPGAPSLDRKYLRAGHDYQPEHTAISGSSGGISITAPLREGDIVLIHLTHPNGWADGTILSTGTRGWIPTNYCQIYDPRPMRSLLHALTRMWDYLSLGATNEALFEDRQDYVQGLVAGVRRLLEHCDCLHRDDAMIKRHIALRRTRKSLLADLSGLLKNREDIHNTFSDSSDAVVWSTVDEYLSSAFKIACRGARFLDIWAQSTSPKQRRSITRCSEAYQSPRTARTSIHVGLSSSPLPNVDEDSVRPSPPDGVKKIPRFQLRVLEYDEVSQHSKVVDEQFGPELTSEDLRRVLSHDTLSPVQSSPTASGSVPAIMSELALAEKNMSDLASERLTAAHEQFLGDIGAFIGLHLQSRASLDLATTTRHSIKAAEDLLAIVGKISEQNTGRCQSIAGASENMRMKLKTLAETANRLCRIPADSDDPETIGVVGPEDGRGLVAAATACVRAAGDCTAKTRKFIDHISGDFFLPSTTQDQEEKPGPVRLIAHVEHPGEISTDNWSEAAAGTANPQHRNSTESNLPLRGLPQRPAYLLRSTTDDTNNFTLSTVLPDGNMRRPDSSPPLVTCDTPISPISPTASEPPLQSPPPPADESPEQYRQDHQEHWTPPPDRKGSLGMSTTESSSAYQDSLRNSLASVASPTSTRATTPDRYQRHVRANPSLCTHESVLSVATTANGSEHDIEVLMKSYAHELLYNKDGQVVGGSLAALVEKLTSQHGPPEPEYNTAFLLTFRLFTNAVELTQALITRYEYAGDCNADSSPARLRVYNFFKTWLESHYLAESDAPALEIIHRFAVDRLSVQFSGPGKRLAELTKIASQIEATSVTNQLVSAIGKTCVALGSDYEKTIIPHANINKEQLYLLTGAFPTRKLTLLDLDAVEIARQITILESKRFCAILPHELLGLEWTKKNGQAENVLAMSKFSTSLTNLVVDTILGADQIKRRVAVLKHWIKIAKQCLDIDNYSALMAIACSLTTSAITRLRQTWDQLPPKTNAVFEEIKEVVEVSRNYAALRQRLQTPKAPCLPFVGMYLTDLTFVDAGNSNTRPLPSDGDDGSEMKMVINFDKHMRSARVVSHLQRYQVPYRLQHIREIQDWLEIQLDRVNKSDQCTVMSFWRRSQALEARRKEEERPETADGREKTFGSGFMGSMLRPRAKPSSTGLNSFLHRVKTGGSSHSTE